MTRNVIRSRRCDMMTDWMKNKFPAAFEIVGDVGRRCGAVWIVLSAFGLPEKWGMTETGFNGTLNAVGTVLVAFGILNNPTDKQKF